MAIGAGREVTFYLTVERAFTGDIAVGSTLNVTWNSRTHQGTPDGAPSYRGIWFLHKNGTGKWECDSAGANGNAEYFPDLSLPVSDEQLPPELAYDANATSLTDRLVLEMAAGRPRNNPFVVFDVIGETKSPAVLRALRHLAASSSRDQALAGIAGLIQSGDTNGLLTAEALSETLTNTGASGRIAAATRLFFRNPDPVAIASLGRIATSGKASSMMQESAAYAIVAIHSVTAAPWFGLMLSNPSTAMQIEGARGLSYFVNGTGVSTPQTMRTLDHLNHRQPTAYRTPETDEHIGFPTGQPEPFVQFWQTWWAQHPELHTPEPIQ